MSGAETVAAGAGMNGPIEELRDSLRDVAGRVADVRNQVMSKVHSLVGASPGDSEEKVAAEPDCMVVNPDCMVVNMVNATNSINININEISNLIDRL